MLSHLACLPCYLVPSTGVRLRVIIGIFLYTFRSLAEPHSLVSVQFVKVLMSSSQRAPCIVADTDFHRFPTEILAEDRAERETRKMVISVTTLVGLFVVLTCVGNTAGIVCIAIQTIQGSVLGYQHVYIYIHARAYTCSLTHTHALCVEHPPLVNL